MSIFKKVFLLDLADLTDGSRTFEGVMVKVTAELKGTKAHLVSLAMDDTYSEYLKTLGGEGVPDFWIKEVKEHFEYEDALLEFMADNCTKEEYKEYFESIFE